MNRACAPSPRRGIAPKFPTLSADRRWTCPGDLWIWYPFFHIFLFLIPWTRYARYAPGGENIPFLRIFIYTDDVQAPMRHTPPGLSGTRSGLRNHQKIKETGNDYFSVVIFSQAHWLKWYFWKFHYLFNLFSEYWCNGLLTCVSSHIKNIFW